MTYIELHIPKADSQIEEWVRSIPEPKRSKMMVEAIRYEARCNRGWLLTTLDMLIKTRDGPDQYENEHEVSAWASSELSMKKIDEHWMTHESFMDAYRKRVSGEL